MQRCVDALVERHESLRTTFSSQDGEPLQIIHPGLAVPVVVVAPAAPDMADTEALARAAQEAATPFDLAAGPLLRVRVFTIEPRRQVVVITAHHIVFDGWSVAVFCEELSVLYRAFSAGQPSPLPAVDIQYADYVVWQQKRLTPERVAGQLDYWRATLGTAGEPVPIGDRPQPVRPTGHGATLTWSLDVRVTEGLRRLCRAEQATTFMAVVTLLDVLLARHTGAEELLIGTPLAARPRPELERTVGFFANTVVIRSDLSGAPTFRELLRRVKAASLGAMAHADVPFEQVVQAVQPARGLGQVPLFRVMVAVQRVPDVLVELDGLDVRVLRVGTGTAKFDLLLDVQERASDIELTFEYSTDVIDDETCRRWRARFTQLVEAACVAPDTLIAELPVVTADEARDLARWNATTVARDDTATPLSLVALQVARTPEALAVSYDGRSLSYHALDARANQLAHALRGRGVQRGDRVAIGLERSLDLAVAVLGVLKAGAAYVPIDPAYPIDRIRFMVEDADVRVLLAPPALAASVLGDDPARRGFTEWARAASACPPTSPVQVPAANDACYVMYTSGSTGQPKGVVMPHGALANLVEWQVRRSAPALATLQFSALGFDVSF
ncbi:MAG TPA: condensation domain-containing protein, partial [Vicinamibacterales bacterium]|nr:condensation domain-containing protein [Vicinamibacterales bacterium]